MTGYKKVAKLPALPRLKVKEAVLHKSNNKCLVIMSTLLNCWSSNGEGASVCKNLESDLKVCMDNFKPPVEVKSSLNYHAARLFPVISGNKK